MSKTLKVTYGTSILIGDRWDKIGVEEEPEKGDTLESILDSTIKKINAWHEKQYPEFYKKPEDKKQDKPKPEPDIIILKKYDNAVLSGDTKTKEEIEKNYNIL